MSATVQEPLRDRIGRVLYEEPGRGLDWYSLSEERREPWRKDADRVLAEINRQPETDPDSEMIADEDCECGEDTCVCEQPQD